MANPSTPFGFKRIKADSGLMPRLQEVIRPSSDAVKLYIGDLVQDAGTTDATGEFREVLQGAASTKVFGVVESIIGVYPSGEDMNNSNLFKNFVAASTAARLLVCTDPKAEYVAVEDSVGGNLAAVDCGLNVDVVVNTGNDPLGLSGMQIDSSTKATTITLPLKLVKLHMNGTNAIGTNAQWVVRINNAVESGGDGSTGS